MEDTDTKGKVCVTGGSGYIASWLIMKLLRKGYSVNATLRRLADEEKVRLVRSLPGAATRLELFEADIYKPHQFERAIQGCEFVFHVATPFQHVPDSQYKDEVEAAVESTKSIVQFCIKAGSVKRLIYAASVVAASPLKEDGSGYKDSMDESCWSPLHLSIPYSNERLQAYLESKTLTEKEILEEDNKKIEVVTLALGLVGGETLLPYLPLSTLVLLSTRLSDDNDYAYQALMYLEELLGKVPVLHVKDACRAFVFCMEQPSMCGRYLCATSYVHTSEIHHYSTTMHPQLHTKRKNLDEPKRDIKWGTTKLIDKGFAYKYDLKMTLDDSIKTAKRLAQRPC